MDEEKVPKYKLTKDTVAFIRRYKKINSVSKVLTNKLEVQLMEADQVRQMLQQVEGLKGQLLQAAPENPIYELDGQDPTKYQLNF